MSTPVVMQLQRGQTRLYAHLITEAFSVADAVAIAAEFGASFVQDLNTPAWRNVARRDVDRQEARRHG